MTRRATLLVHRTLLGLGVGVTAAAVGWWALSFGEVYAHDYITLREAVSCSVADSEICRLAASWCRARHAIIVAPYRSASLWAGAAILFASLAAPSSRDTRAGGG